MELKAIQKRMVMIRDMKQYPYGSYTTGATVFGKND